MKRNQRNKGITLIALVVTIIVLIILSTVTIRIILGRSGILERSKNAGTEYNQESAKEKLELVLADLQADKISKKDYNENEYIDNRLKANNMQVEGDIVIVDTWQFEIDRSVPKIRLELEQLTQETALKPMILKVNKKVEETKVQVSAQLRNPEGTTLVYSIKQENASEDLEKSEPTSELQYTFDNLQKGKKYDVTIQATNSYGAYTKVEQVVTGSSTAVLVSSIELSPKAVTLTKDKTKELTYTILPSNADDMTVTWSSSDETIAKVENGIITAVATGECTITCKSNDGAAEATCNVTVVNGTGIQTAADLKAISSNLSGEYVLLNDIDLSGEDWTTLGSSYEVGYFTGTLDGNGYAIKNLTQPLFYTLKNATIKNLKLDNVSIDMSTEQYVGALARQSYYENTITNVGVIGTQISGKLYTGGLVGAVTLTDNSTGRKMTVTNCYVRINLKNDSEYDSAGIVDARGYADVENCYFIGSITATSRSGPIVGTSKNDNSKIYADVTNCYYKSELLTNLNVPSGAGTGLTTAQFADSTNFKDWDFTNTWIIKNGVPELRIFVKE